jgi:hypothetical protein
VKESLASFSFQPSFRLAFYFLIRYLRSVRTLFTDQHSLILNANNVQLHLFVFFFF